MSSRMYLSTITSPITPAFLAEWDLTTSAKRYLLVKTAAGSHTTQTTILLTKGSTNFLDQDRLLAQFISPALAAQTISGTVKGRIMCAESTANGQLRSQMTMHVVDAGGNVVRGTLYAGDLATLTGDPTSEWPLTTKANRQMPRGSSVSLSSLAVLDGDRIVVGIGYRVHTTSTANFSGSIIVGDYGTTDLPEDETDTDDTKLPWLEFSQTLLFAGTRCRAIAEWEA